MPNGKVKGSATLKGTSDFRMRFSGALHKTHFRQSQGLWFSSIGLGTYLGEPDDHVDALYGASIEEALNSGINVIDTAINYRMQRSERVIGKTLKRLVREGKIRREEVILSTKGGFIPFDQHFPEDPQKYFLETYAQTEVLKPSDVARGCHAITPRYLEDQLEKSLTNLCVETVDIYYLHNPETQLEETDREGFLKKMREAFAWCEQKVAQGKIRMYGIATWDGCRVKNTEKNYLSLEELSKLAKEVSGEFHHFRALQVPFNFAMPEAWLLPNQNYDGAALPLFEAAEKLAMTVMASATLLQSRLTQMLPEFISVHFKHLPKPVHQAIQFSRSVPGVVASLVGMKSKAHVAENLEVAKSQPMTVHELVAILRRSPKA